MGYVRHLGQMTSKISDHELPNNSNIILLAKKALTWSEEKMPANLRVRNVPLILTSSSRMKRRL